MDVNLLLSHSQYAVPVGIVLICAILVFAFGFKKAEQPPFAQLSTSSDVDRKSLGKKRSKIREKKAANGQVTVEKSSPSKKAFSAKTEPKKSSIKSDEIEGNLKEQKHEDNKVLTSGKKERNQESTKSGKENKAEQVKNKKNLKNLVQEKPVDFDDGDWEQAYSRKDKKNKKKEEESPSKKSKKSTKKTDIINEAVAKEREHDKLEIKDKVAKETENKELKEKDKKDIVLQAISNEIQPEETIAESQNEQIKSEKADKTEKEEKKKSKKTKKVSEGGTTPTSVPSTPKAEIKTNLVKEKEVIEVEKVEDNKMKEETTELIQVESVEEKASAMFDELADVWTEAKPQKKSKKKARKEN